MKRNLFDLDNARYLNKRELVDTFIPTKAFHKILSPKNQIIIGSRGSGKTALLRMISHDHLSLLDDEIAKEIIESKLYIGTHISTKTKFISGLKNKDWESEKDKEFHFRWLMNLASCAALLETLKSCLNVYEVDEEARINLEVQIVSELSKLWLPECTTAFTIHDLEGLLENVTFQKSRRHLERKIYGEAFTKEPIGLTFDMELFEPILSAISVINRKMQFPSQTTWFICIDEIEILEEFHHRILNSYMRSFTGNVFFKFTTLPYGHYTLDTNTNVPLEVRHDVHYVYIDQDPAFQYRVERVGNSAFELFERRAQLSKPEYAGFDLENMFGSSFLLDRIKLEEIIAKGPDGFESASIINDNKIIKLFKKYAGEPTKTRGLELLNSGDIEKFKNEFGRKMRGLLMLRDEYDSTRKGNHAVKLYSGAKIIITLGDANPRKLLGIYNEMLKSYEASTDFLKHKEKRAVVSFRKNKGKIEEDSPIISSTLQNFVLTSLAEREINKSRIEKNIGRGLYDFILAIGEFMRKYIHDSELTTEQISSISISNNIDENTWEVIKRAVQKGLLYPNINVHNPDEMPYKEGTFRLGYILSPKFKILPRKGDSRNVNTILPSQLKFEFDA